MKIAIVPSNQHQNTYTGLPSVTEERWAVAVCQAAEKRLVELGADARSFHVPGVGATSTDELARMIDRAIAWRPDYTLSVHSDAVGDKAQTGILMLMARAEDANKGQRLGLAIAAHVGLPYKATWVYGLEARKILYLRRLRETGLQGSLVEVGEHATAAEAKWNWEHIKEIGVGIADALAEYLELDASTEEDDMAVSIVDPVAAQKAEAALAKAGIITKPGVRKPEEAVSWGLVCVLLARVLATKNGGDND